MKVLVYTAAWCRDCRSAKQFLDSHGIGYTEINVDDDPAASDEVMHHVGKRAIPQLVIDGASGFLAPEGIPLVQSKSWQRLAVFSPIERRQQ